MREKKIPKILVIDDSADIRETVSDLLTRAGHDVMLAADGNEGMKCIETASPDLVITDLIMPEKDGIQTILDIRNSNADLPIIAMSGGGHILACAKDYKEDLLESSTALGANYAVAKPFRSRDFMNVVAQALTAAR